MKKKYDHDTIITLQDLVVDKVAVTRMGVYGGVVAIRLINGDVIQMHCRLYSEAKEKVKPFKTKFKIAQKVASELGMFK